jgi:hypothetical protein
MTLDESAWTVFITELRKRDLLNIAGAASAALAQLQRAAGAVEPERSKPLCTQGHLYVDDCERAGHAVIVEAPTMGTEKHDATRMMLSIRNLVNEALVQRGLGRPERMVELLHAALKAMDGMMGTPYPIADGEPCPSTTDAGARERLTSAEHDCEDLLAERDEHRKMLNSAIADRDCWSERHQRMERERDSARRDAHNFQEQRDANLALLQAARAQTEAVEKAARAAEARADASFRERVTLKRACLEAEARAEAVMKDRDWWRRECGTVRALLKEALGLIKSRMLRCREMFAPDRYPNCRADDVLLGKAKAAGYGVEP